MSPDRHHTESADVRTAVILLSGGLDSAVTAACARGEGRGLIALSFEYGQRHRAELSAAARVAEHLGVRRHVVLPLDLRAIGGSALTADIAVPKDTPAAGGGIPVTYVPARNLVFLSLASGLAEVEGAGELWIGVNAVDYSGYPDCRPGFVRSFEETVNLATKAGVEAAAAGRVALRVRTPLLELSKAEIVQRGTDLGVDLSLTHSCYDPPDERGTHCGRCEACGLRRRGFSTAGVEDPTVYAR